MRFSSAIRRNERKIDALVNALTIADDHIPGRNMTLQMNTTVLPVAAPNTLPAEFVDSLFSLPDDSIEGHRRRHTFSTEEPDVEYKAIQEMRKVAEQYYQNKNYAVAEPILRKILFKSEEKYLIGFTWRDQTMAMLAKSCCRVSKFDEADKLFHQSFEGRDVLMETLTKEYLERGKISEAEKIMVREFQGRHPLLELLGGSYMQARKWKEAKNVLLELLKYDAEEKVRCQRIYLLAKICYSLRQLKAAEEWCLIAVRGTQATLGERHHQFYESVNLLVNISQAKGDHVEAGAYRAVLADLPPGLQGI